MPHVSRPLIGLLVATVVFFALWIVALKPSSSGTSASQGLGQYQPAINAAKSTVAASAAAAAAATAATASSGGATTTPTVASSAVTPAQAPISTTPKSSSATATPKSSTTAAPVHAAAPARAGNAPKTASPTERLTAVDRALAQHKVLALLFYNPAAADDRAVKQELRTIPTRSGRVLKLAIPVSELSHYPVVTNQVPIQTSPTLVIIDRSAQAFTLVGFTTGFEIAHRVDDALGTR